MALDDFTKKASDLAAQASKLVQDNSEQIKNMLDSEQAEKISDTVLDNMTDLANKITGGKHAEKIEEVRNNLDGKIGNE